MRGARGVPRPVIRGCDSDSVRTVVIAEERGSFVGPHIHQRATGFLRRAAARGRSRIPCAVGRLLGRGPHEWRNGAMPDPATEQADHIFMPVALRVDRRADHRRHRLGPDLLGDLPLPPPARRRDPDPDPLQPAARDLLHDRADHHGGRLLQRDDQRAERRPRGHRRRTTSSTSSGQQWSWTFNYTERRGHRRRGHQRLHSRHRQRHPDARAAGRPDDPVQPVLARRHPLLRGPRVPDADGRHPRPDQPLRGHARHRGHATRASATSSAAPTTPGCCSTSRWSASTSSSSTCATCRRPGYESEGPVTGRRTGLHAGRARRAQRGGRENDRRQQHTRRPRPAASRSVSRWSRILTTTDHKLIGKLYLGHVVRAGSWSAA